MSTPEQADRNARNVLELVQVKRQLHHDRDTILQLRERLAYVVALQGWTCDTCEDEPRENLVRDLQEILDRPSPAWREGGQTDHLPDQSVSGQRARVGGPPTCELHRVACPSWCLR